MTRRNQTVLVGPNRPGWERHCRSRALAFAFAAALAIGFLICLGASSKAAASKGVVGSVVGLPGSSAPGHLLGAPLGIAVNETTGDFYVTDSKHRVAQYNSMGGFIRMWGRDVVNTGAPNNISTSAVEICDTTTSPPNVLETDCKAGSSTGGIGGEFNEGNGVAINRVTGDIYVGERRRFRIQQFTATGKFIRTWGRDVVTTGKPNNVSTTAFEICDTTTSPPNVAADCKTGVSAAAGGAFATNSGRFDVAVVPQTAPNAGNVLVTDGANGRVQEFTGSGAFVRVFGWDVLPPSSASNIAKNEVQELVIRAVDGQFSLTWGGSTTPPLPFDAPASGLGSVESALNALSSISAGGGSVGVTGGPGDASGSNPYVVTFNGGPRADTDVSSIAINNISLAKGVGTTMGCSGPTENLEGGGVPETVKFQWLRNGVPIPGATASEYETVQADHGKLVQCQTFAFTSESGSTQASLPAVPVGEAPAVEPPEPQSPTLPGVRRVPDVELHVGGEASGEQLTCTQTGTWKGSPTITARWYRNGVPLVGSGANTAVYTLRTVDLVTPAMFTCALTGTNAAGSVTRVTPNVVLGSGSKAGWTTPRPISPKDGATVTAGLVSPNTTTTGASFEVCNLIGECRAGSLGSAAGQFGTIGLSRLAVGADGSIFTVEQQSNFRVQEFEASLGNPPLSPSPFGGPGAPTGTSSEDAPVDIAAGADDDLLVLRRFPKGAAPTCSDGLPISSPEDRIQVLSGDDQSLLDTYMTCGRIMSSDPAIAVNRSTGRLYVGSDTVQIPSGGSSFTSLNRVFILDEPIAPDLTVFPPASTASSATVSGTIDPNPGSYPNPPDALYQLEYRLSSESDWKRFLTPLKVGAADGAVPFTSTLFPLRPNSEYEVRVILEKEFGSVRIVSAPYTFDTLPTPPAIEKVSSSNVREDSAILNARINPNGDDTEYYFEYGTTTAYGHVAPISPEGIGNGYAGVPVFQEISGLSAATYHFRLVAENEAGITRSEDQTFNFRPEGCPNAALRQLTGASYLPDCRAYEIASPENANGALLLGWAGPNTPTAVNPPRVAFAAVFGGIPDVGDAPGLAELYVATRTDTGWETSYVGRPATETVRMGALPLVPNNGYGGFYRSLTRVPTDPAMSRFAMWDHGYPLDKFLNTEPNPLRSFAPYVLTHTGQVVGRWPTNLPTVEGGESFGSPQQKVSDDFSHFVFVSDIVNQQGGPHGHVPFLPGGLPGDIYDNNLETGTLEIISRDPGGEPFSGSIVDLSHDGSRILMSSKRFPHCLSTVNKVNPSCSVPVQASEFFMRVDGVTLDVTQDHNARYQGMASDGSRVYFLSDEQVTDDDTDTSSDLFMWSESSGEITRVSVGIAGTGDTDSCNPVEAWIGKCGIGPISNFEQTCATPQRCSPEPEFFHAYSRTLGGVTGNGLSDNFVASQSGDIYFFSPEQLTGAEGVNGRANLFVYRKGEVQFVASLDPNRACVESIPGSAFSVDLCNSGPIARIQVSPDGRYAAFTTKSQLTAYDNAGKTMMYRYDADDRRLICVSCPPGDDPPTDDVRASQNGLFMTDDGRAFFSTRDGVVPPDTNEALDVYEFVDGRPQLISDGLSPEGSDSPLGTAPIMREGLIGVSANGTDVYFGTRGAPVPQDQNGGNIKIYNARVNGGFPFSLDTPLCAAADECHAGSSLPPPPLADGSSADRGAGGNLEQDLCLRKNLKAKQASRRVRALRGRSAGSRQAKGVARSARRAMESAKRCQAQSKGRAGQ